MSRFTLVGLSAALVAALTSDRWNERALMEMLADLRAWP